MATKYNWKDTTPPPVSDTWQAGDSLGKKIETMFVRFVQRAFVWAIDFVSDRLVDIFDNSMKIMRPGSERMSRDALNFMKSIPDLPPFVTKMLEAIETEEGESSFLGKLIVMYVAVRGIIFGGLEPYARWANYKIDKSARSFVPDPMTLASLYQTGIMKDEGLQEGMSSMGVPDRLIPLLVELTRRIPSPQEISVGRWRGVKTDQEFRDDLRRNGYSDRDIQMFDELSKQIPPISDLIRMLVRDAFNDGVSSTFGYDEDFPEAINEFFEKQGYNAEWAKRYWRSHWVLPSPTQAYEMLHRGLITVDDIETLLKTSDYPPFWREKLIAISYNVLTRVDVRRLLQAGLIDEIKAQEVYNQMGYTPDDAKLLTEFAVMGITQEERDLTKTDVLNLYEEGVIDRDTTSANLVKMGYDSEEAETILKLADVNIAKAERTDLINYTKEKFIAKQLDEQGARDELTSIGLKSQSVERYVMNWVRAKEVDITLPTIADTKRWFMGNYIDEAKARSLLELHKHTSEHIDIYLKEWINLKGEQENEALA